MTNRDDELMGAALVEARKSLDVDEFPVGAVVVLADEVVVRARTGKGRPSVGSWVTPKCSPC